MVSVSPSMNKLKKKFTPLSVHFKRKVIVAVEENPTKKKVDIAKEFNITLSTLSTILRNKKHFSGKSGTFCKQLKPGELIDVDKCVVKWLKTRHDKNEPITGPLLQKRAQKFARILGHSSFHASNRWLHSFKKRYGSVLRQLCGESVSVDEMLCQNWKETLLEHTEGYHPNNIFSAGEIGLFFQCLPDKTLSLKDDTHHGGNNNKERITVLLCANITGTVKLKPLVIGQSKQPRCFQNSTTLPTYYSDNRKALMNRDAFTTWLKNLNKEMKRKNKHILMMVDDCIAHTDVPLLSNIKIKLLPQNPTPKLQPLDKGIKKDFKSHYRKEIVHRFLRDFHNSSPTKINLLDAMWMITKAWHNVNKTTISNCFKKSGFNITEDEDVEDETSIPIDIAPRDWTKVKDTLDLQEIKFEEFVTFDDNIAVCDELSETDVTEIEEEEEVEGGRQANIEPTVQNARKALNLLKCMFLKNNCLSDEVVKSITVLDSTLDAVNINAGKQTNINDF